MRTVWTGISVCLALLAAQNAEARVWHVDLDGTADFTSIQAAIDAASPNDTVLVAAGTYEEAVNYGGKDLVVMSSNGPEFTIIDASSLGGTGVYLGDNLTRASVFRGFKVMGGNRGIGVFHSEPIVSDNIVLMNGGFGLGTGIGGGGSGAGPWSPLIENNQVMNNSANNSGPGIYFFQRVNPVIVNNYIFDNSAGHGDGGGIYLVTAYDGAIIRGNVIHSNVVGDHGGGIHVANGGLPINLEIAYNLIWNNSAGGQGATGGSGGGIWARQTNAWIHHNTIVENTGLGPSSDYGGGITVQHAGTPVIEQNIIAFTQAGAGIRCVNGSTPVIRNNLIWENTGGHAAGDCTGWPGTDGNTVADPAFCDPENGDFTVAEESPGMVHTAGPLGAFPVPGCEMTPVRSITWGLLKSQFPSR